MSLLKQCLSFSWRTLHHRGISSSQKLSFNKKWREENGLPANPNSFGPLTNLPDYTYLDGRPTPMTSNMKKRILRQRQVAEQIVTMCKELDEAKQRYVHLQEKRKNDRQEILQQKLRPKGKELLKS